MLLATMDGLWYLYDVEVAGKGCEGGDEGIDVEVFR